MNNYFFHENNIIGKINKNYKNIGTHFSHLKSIYYDLYKDNQLKIINFTRTEIISKVCLLNQYYKDFDTYFSSNNINLTQQSKIRPTILEEFCGFLFKDLPILSNLGLDFFNKKIFAGLTLDSRGNVKPKEKDIDFCIGKKIQAQFNGINKTIIIPLIAVECKTWLDKTMLGEAQFTAMKFKNSNPDVSVFLLAGYSGIAHDEVPRKSQTQIDQIYLIGDTRKSVNDSVIYNFFVDIKKSLNNIQINNIQINIGKLLQN